MNESVLLEFKEKLSALREEVTKNTELTKDSSSDIQQLLEMFRSAKGGFKVLGWFGNVMKWASSIGLAVMGLWGAYQTLKGIK